jgi:hypothetical protein
MTGPRGRRLAAATGLLVGLVGLPLLLLAMVGPVGARYSVTSCHLRVLMDQPTEAISPHDAPHRHIES